MGGRPDLFGTRYRRAVTSLPGAGSTAVRHLLLGPPGPGRVLGAHPTCLYLGVGAEVVAVESADAVGLPLAVRLAADASAGPFTGVRRGEPVTVGGGMLVLGTLTVRVARWWAPRRPRPGLDLARLVAVERALARHPAPVPVDAAPADLLGRGPGLTPAGDDVLAGLLVALHHAPALRDGVAGQVLRRAARRTTALSAGLLRLAAAGHGVPALLDLADVLAGHGPADRVGAALDRLLAVGHSSGTALAWGLSRGGRTLADLAQEVA